MQIAPFSNRGRGYLVGSLPDGFGYAFNFEDPSGVKLLNPALYSAMQQNRRATDLTSVNPKMGAATARLAENPQAASRKPRLTVWLHLVNGCNFACHYCYIPHLNRNVPKSEVGRYSLKKEIIHPLLGNLIAYCNSQQISELRIIFAGGEPTLNPPLIDAFCREAMQEHGSINISFGMISNGSFHFQEIAPLLNRYRISLSISVDGFEASHDKTRFETRNGRKTGSWHNVSENVQKLLAAGFFPYFLYTVSPTNYREISKFAGFVHSKGIGFRLSLVRGHSVPSSELQDAVAQELRQFYMTLAEELDPDLPIFRYAAFAEWDLYRKKYSPCTSCRNYFAIGPNGGVASCQMRMDRTYGNAVFEQFSAIASRVRGDAANRNLSDPGSRKGACASCEFFHVCAGGCPQHTLRANGSMDHPSPWCHVYGTLMPEYIRAIARQLQRAVLAKFR